MHSEPVQDKRTSSRQILYSLQMFRPQIDDIAEWVHEEMGLPMLQEEGNSTAGWPYPDEDNHGKPKSNCSKLLQGRQKAICYGEWGGERRRKRTTSKDPKHNQYWPWRPITIACASHPTYRETDRDKEAKRIAWAEEGGAYSPVSHQSLCRAHRPNIGSMVGAWARGF